MKILLAISLLFIIGFTFENVNAETRIVKQVSTVPNYNYSGNLYARDLTRIEEYLFGRTYTKENLNTRINRVEKELFNRNYPSMNLAQRMNNIIANYKDDYENRNYLTKYYNRSISPSARIRNRFVGTPTGYTPSIFNTPFGGIINPGFSHAYSTNRGYGFNNSIPAMSGAGINILH